MAVAIKIFVARPRALIVIAKPRVSIVVAKPVQ